MKIPTQDEFAAYKGAHCFQLWASTASDWRCPGCDRNKFELLRWTTRFPRSPKAFKDWMAGLHRHHDHSVDHFERGTRRFVETVICDQCNAADGAAKRILKLPAKFSFAPPEIRAFVVARPHGKHQINYEIARAIFESLRLFW